MRFGLHIPIAGGLQRAASLAQEAGCQTLQIFSGNPRSWKSSPPHTEAVETFAETLAKSHIFPLVLHTPYLVNLASPDEAIWRPSIAAVRQAVELAQVYQARYVVTHVGNHKGSGLEVGIARVVEALREVLAEGSGEAMILLENGPGAGTEISSQFEQNTLILEALGDIRDRIGICLDTAHLWAAGYDISTKEGVEETFKRFDEMVGLDKLPVMHANDNLQRFGGHRDRHENLGEGLIGRSGFRALFHHPRLQELTVIMETPGEVLVEGKKNVALARTLAR